MRVSDETSREAVCACEEAAGKEDLPFDFFICPNIPRPNRNGYFLPHRLESLLGRQQRGGLARLQPRRGKHAQVRHRARHPEHRRGNPGPGYRHLAEVLQRPDSLGPQIQWLHSYVTQDKIYCVYIAPNEEMVREHARQGGFPANRVSEVKLVIDPTSAEA